MDQSHETLVNTDEYTGSEPDDWSDKSERHEGFTWSCCPSRGDDAGCMHTRHRAAVNRVVERRVEEGAQVRGRRKRKAEVLT